LLQSNGFSVDLAERLRNTNRIWVSRIGATGFGVYGAFHFYIKFIERITDIEA
jgi:hypothetical protein